LGQTLVIRTLVQEVPGMSGTALSSAQTEEKLIYALSQLPNRCEICAVPSASGGGLYRFARLSVEWQAEAAPVVDALARVFSKRGEISRAQSSITDVLSKAGVHCGPPAFHAAVNPVGLHISLPEGFDAPDTGVLYFNPRRIQVLNNSSVLEPAQFDPELFWALRFAVAVDTFADEDCTVPLPVDYPHISIAFFGTRRTSQLGVSRAAKKSGRK
jgi:hypothetical protein